MTAHELIADIFSRPKHRIAPDLCWVTIDQLTYLRRLISQDKDRAKVHQGAPGSLVWSPDGDWKYVITEDAGGRKHRLMRSARVSDLTPSLFQEDVGPHLR